MKKFFSMCLAFALMLSVGLVASSNAVMAKEQAKPGIGTQAIDITGVWRGNDGGYYYIRQIGNTVWWTGLSNNGVGTNWTNVFKGQLNGDKVAGTWADVPRGGILSHGNLSFTVVYTQTGMRLHRTAVSGGFGGSVWYR
ncbi:hypothetical protein SAMN04487866_109110 [Thermoactinomyces sp. DSM 45891]|uniref:hypothetical protein n=1 Tax=Thermoactinomyces sp. DSM 45891 TaxID=1761907 RepID=UPI0009187342|nr:hypothetical protein [Thermoactinomyces sp. DSM 45891]SFX49770.1 hypothetical protein SAMN04487866_109110 [Thermoactinomyces sp. DSM 45891]